MIQDLRKIKKIKLASKNPVKIEALKEIIQEYPHLKDSEIFSMEVLSEVADQPKSLEEETIKGAIRTALIRIDIE